MSKFTKVANNIWFVDGETVDFLGVCFPTRSVVVELPNNRLWVWSPIKLKEKLRAEIAQLGDVTYLVSPNTMHHLFLGDWQKAFPSARIFGPQTTAKKRSDLHFQKILGAAAPSDWANEIEQVHFKGSTFFEEIGFFHIESGTLLLADMMVRLPEDFLNTNWHGWRRYLAPLLGVTSAQAKAPLETRMSFLNHKHLRHAKQLMQEWPIDRILLAHGDLVEQDCHIALAKSFGWVR